MKNTVKIYKVWVFDAPMMSETGATLSIHPWSGNTVAYKGESELLGEFILPEGVEVAEMKNGEIQLWDNDAGYIATIIGNDSHILCRYIDGRMSQTKLAKA